MGLPDMRNWSEEAKQKAFAELEERDRLLGCDKVVWIGKVMENGRVYDEEDWSRDSQGL